MTIFEAKALANDILYAPFILIFGIIYAVLFKMDSVSIILTIFTPLVGLICSSYLGLLINLAFPRMEWQNETQVIKQSKSVIINMLISIGANILIIGLSILAMNVINISIVEIMLCVLVIYLGVMVFLEYLLRTWGVRKFQKLY
jgi:ABC-2 type transport system permease protein